MKTVTLPRKIILLFFCLAFLFLAKESFAYYTKDNYTEQFTESVFVNPDINQPSFTWETTQALTASLNTMIVGCLGATCPPETQGNGAINGVSSLIAAIYTNPPASGATYLADLGKNLGIIKPAYAQTGTGFSGLSPILPIWKAFRNIAYFFFTIIFVVIGFAIMFRLKISPQVVVSIQSTLPRIIIALILVTFSYAIAGFLIDLMYLVLLLLFNFLQGQGLGGPTIDITGGFFELIKSFVGASPDFGKLVFGGSGLATLFGGIMALFGVNPVGMLILGIGGGLIFLVFSIILLYVVIKLFLALVSAYISIILSIIFAPLQIMLGAIPGQPGFGSWMRNLVANIAVFPAVALYFFIAGSIIQISYQEGLWMPPMVSLPGVVPAIIGLGMLLMAHKVPEMVKNAFQVKPFPYGTAIGEAVGFGARPITYPLGVGRAAAERGIISYGGAWAESGLGRVFGRPTRETEGGEADRRAGPPPTG